MATVAENLQILINIKKGIKNAINDKGGTVTDSTPYADYATEIENLPSGGEDIWKGMIDRSISGDIRIPNDMTKIGSNAFNQCTRLTSVDMPNVTSIGDSGFTNCSKLTSVSMPNVTSIGTNAFGSCSGLTSVDIPNATSIGASGFTGCKSILSVNFRDMFTVGNASFYNCSGLTDIYSYGLPATITYSGTSASFRSVHSGGTLHVPSGFSSLYTQKNWLNTATNGLGAQNWTIVDDLPEYVPQNVLYATYNVTSASSATKISNVSMSASTQALKYNETYYVSGITTAFTFSETGLQTLEFVNTKELTSNAFQNCISLTSIEIPNSVRSISNNAFSGCTSLTRINSDVDGVFNIPNSATSIGDSAFQNCTSLTSVTIPNSVRSIGSQAFGSCTSLASLTIPNSVTSIGNYAFYNCSGLTTIVIDNATPPTLSNSYTFSGTPSTLKIYVPDEAVDAYKTATNWTVYASKIYPLSQKP